MSSLRDAMRSSREESFSALSPMRLTIWSHVTPNAVRILYRFCRPLKESCFFQAHRSLTDRSRYGTLWESSGRMWRQTFASLHRATAIQSYPSIVRWWITQVRATHKSCITCSVRPTWYADWRRMCSISYLTSDVNLSRWISRQSTLGSLIRHAAGSLQTFWQRCLSEITINLSMIALNFSPKVQRTLLINQ